MGLLDALSSDDAKLGIGLLAAGGYSPTPLSTGQRLQMAMQGVSADKQNALKLKLLQSQMDENASQNALRQAQIGKLTDDQAFMKAIAQRLNGGGAPVAGGTPAVSAGVAPGVGGVGGVAPMGGMSGGGSGGAGANGFPLTFGETVMAGLRGHDLMPAFKYANEPEELKPGSLYRNRMTGSVESLPSVSQNGQASQILPDPTAPGGYRVIAPNGAVDVYRQYKNIDNRSAADYQPETVVDTTPGPTYGQKIVKPRSQVLQPQAAPAPSNAMIDSALTGIPAPEAGVTGNFTGSYEQARRAVADIKNPQERSNALAALDKQFGTSQAPGNVVELSPEQQNQISANKKYGEGVAADQVEQRKSIMNAGFTASGKISKLQQIDKLLGDYEGGKLSQTGVDFASAMNSLGIKVDKNLPNKEAAQAMSREIALSLRNPAGGAGMPGAMSDSDRNFLQSMTPDIGQTAAGRKQIISAGVAVEKRNQQVADFARKYENKYGKLDNGFYSQLSAWSNANPLFGK